MPYLRTLDADLAKHDDMSNGSPSRRRWNISSQKGANDIN